ncbi:MAG: polysaccharide deacetylase, partial [Ruthenibacterium sp.]
SDIYKSDDAFWNDIDRLRYAIAPYGCGNSMLLRFPGGSTNTVSHKYGGADIMDVLKAQAVERGYTYVDWNVCADDALGGHPSADKIYNNVIHDVGEQRTVVVLMHDAAYTKNTAAALPDIILWFKNAGFRFDTVDHLTKQI